MPHRAHLSKDKKLKPLVERHDIAPLKHRRNVYVELTTNIMSQQLNIKVAAIICNRFLALYGNKNPTPEQVLNTPVETLRSIGLSQQKTGYIHNIARFAIEKGIDYKTLNKMENETAITYLTEIKGVGRWTVEMLLMFSLGREDVFSVGDFGVTSAMIQLYKLDTTDKKKLNEKLHKVAAKWAPYRTYACMYLWRYKDNAPEK
jgi:DNA-3-methyladenine glycosylase II